MKFAVEQLQPHDSRCTSAAAPSSEQSAQVLRQYLRAWARARGALANGNDFSKPCTRHENAELRRLLVCWPLRRVIQPSHTACAMRPTGDQKNVGAFDIATLVDVAGGVLGRGHASVACTCPIPVQQ